MQYFKKRNKIKKEKQDWKRETRIGNWKKKTKNK